MLPTWTQQKWGCSEAERIPRYRLIDRSPVRRFWVLSGRNLAWEQSAAGCQAELGTALPLSQLQDTQGFQHFLGSRAENTLPKCMFTFPPFSCKFLTLSKHTHTGSCHSSRGVSAWLFWLGKFISERTMKRNITQWRSCPRCSWMSALLSNKIISSL